MASIFALFEFMIRGTFVCISLRVHAELFPKAETTYIFLVTIE
jgi:hypothetical protein